MSEAASEGLSRTLVLNGLRDLCGGPPVVADDASREVLEGAFESALHVAERDRFRRTLEESADDPDEMDDENQRFLRACADGVLAELVARGTRATLLHDAPFSTPAREAAVYSFVVSHDPGALELLSASEEVRERLSAGADAVVEGEFDRAVEAFDGAVTESAGGDGAVASRVLAAYACHRAGRDDEAIDYVEETLHLDTRTWTAKLVGYAADHRYPEKFREGKLGARVFFRWSAGVPGTGDVEVAVGPADGSEEPTPLSGSDQCLPIERLWPETTVRVALSGELPAIPTVESYYVATGVADLEVFEARSVEEVLLSGPFALDPEERVRFE